MSFLSLATLALAHQACLGQRHGADDWNLNTLANVADFVFQGTVTSVEYKNSTVRNREDDDELVHTFVTYAVETSFKGDDLPDRVTLRFQGGIVAERQEFVHIAGSPLFQVGDWDILFVKGNGQRRIPLAGEAHGRLRVVNDEVFTYDGKAFSISEGGKLVAGPMVHAGLRAVQLPNKKKFFITSQRLEAGAAGDVSRMKIDEVASRIAAATKGLAATEGTTIRISVDKSKPFYVRRSMALPPPRKVKPAAPGPSEEAQLLRENKGNPVIPKR